MHTLTCPSWRTSFGRLFIRNVFPRGKWEVGMALRQIQEMNGKKKPPQKNANMTAPFDPLIGLLGLDFSQSTTLHGWTGLACLIILAHRYSSRTPTIGAHSELDQKPGSEKWQKAYPSPPRSRALGTGGRAGPQTPMRLVHGSPFSLLFAHNVETAGLQRSLCVASHHISHAALEDAPERVWS